MSSQNPSMDRVIKDFPSPPSQALQHNTIFKGNTKYRY